MGSPDRVSSREHPLRWTRLPCELFGQDISSIFVSPDDNSDCQMKEFSDRINSIWVTVIPMFAEKVSALGLAMNKQIVRAETWRTSALGGLATCLLGVPSFIKLLKWMHHEGWLPDAPPVGFLNRSVAA